MINLPPPPLPPKTVTPPRTLPRRLVQLLKRRQTPPAVPRARSRRARQRAHHRDATRVALVEFLDQGRDDAAAAFGPRAEVWPVGGKPAPKRRPSSNAEKEKDASFSTGPQSIPTHWKQTLFFLREPITVSEGTLSCSSVG